MAEEERETKEKGKDTLKEQKKPRKTITKDRVEENRGGASEEREPDTKGEEKYDQTPFREGVSKTSSNLGTEPQEINREENFREDEIERYELDYGTPEVTGDVVEEVEPGEEYSEEIDSEEDQSEDKDSLRYKDEDTLDTASKKLLNDLRKRVSDLHEKTEELSRRFEEADRRISSLSSKVDRYDKAGQNYEMIEEKLKELSAIYDLFSADVNPFIDISDLTDNNDNNLDMDLDDIDLDFETEKESDDFDETEYVDHSNNLNERYDMSAMIDWIDFLQSKTNGNLKVALDYYQSLGWIDQGLKENMLTYIQGIKLENKDNGHNDKIINEDGEVEEKEGDWKLSPQEHKKSLQYIEDIKNGENERKEESIDENGGEDGRWQRGEG